MDYDFVLGFDCSKSTLDFGLLNVSEQTITHGQIANQVKVIHELVEQVIEKSGCSKIRILLCAEQSGLYTNYLKLAAVQYQYQLWVQDALELKLRSGRQKGKTDKKDAGMIAKYASRYADQAVIYQLPNPIILKIKKISRQRSELMESLTRWKIRLREEEDFGLVATTERSQRIFDRLLKEMKASIKQLDEELLELIKTDELARAKYEIMQSVPGLGPKNSVIIIAETELFTKTKNARACSSYAGICPYKYESGTSVRSRTRTLKPCNKRLKTAFHQGAISLIRRENLYKDLYDRLRSKGRTHLQAINAVRNKMIRVLFACLEKEVMYEKNLHGSLQTQ